MLPITKLSDVPQTLKFSDFQSATVKAVNRLVETIHLLVLATIAIALTACGMLGTTYPEKHGRVLHEILDAPLPNTIVVGLWKGRQGAPGEGKMVCYHVENTVTDDTGFFAIPEWREPGSFEDLADKNIYIYAYRKRYRTSELTNQIITPKNYIYYLAKPRDEDNEEQARTDRLRYLQQLVGDTICDLKGESRANLVPMYTAIVEEAEEIAVTAQDKQVVQKLKSWLSFVTVPEEE